MEQLLTVLSVVSTVCAIVFGYAAFARNRKSDTESEAKSDATVLTEIGYIKGGTAGTAKDQHGVYGTAGCRGSVREAGAQAA